MQKFKLVNPSIVGQFNTTFTSDNGYEAAQKFWNELTPHLTNNVPKLIVTFQREEDNKLFHYQITEKITEGSKIADYNIEELKIKLSQQQEKEFLKESFSSTKKNTKLAVKQAGGKKRYDKINKKKLDDSSDSSDSSDSDSDSSSDYYDFSRFKRISQPIVYWWYNPTLYGVSKLFVPTFNIPVTPYVQMWVPVR
jgi:hypothetical protein